VRRTIAGALGLALVLVLLPATPVVAEFRGTDVWSNIAPAGPGGLADQHPISYYALDYYVDGPSIGLGGPSTGDPVSLVIQVFAALFFMAITFFMRVAIYAFDWAFNIDIIGGRHGALEPVGKATQHLYFSTFVPLIATAVLVFGGWMLYKILERKWGEVGAGLVRTVCLAAAAMVIILNPGDTIGRASSLTRELSGSIASGTTGANGGQDVSDRIFDTFIYQPWAVLEFGGLRRCVSSERDDDGFPKPVGTDDPGRAICRSTLRADAEGHGGYAVSFLRHAPGSDERKELYESIKDGRRPYDRADAPAVDMMQGGGAVQRLAYVVLLGVGIVSAILLLGLLCFAALFAQLGLLVLLAAAPAMVIAAIFPGLHGVFGSWARWIGKLLIAQVVFSLLLAATLGVSAALMSVGGEMGYLPVFALQSILFLGLFVKRKALAAQLTSRKEYSRSESGARSFVGGAAAGAVGAVASPSSAAAMAISKRLVDRQEAAKKPDDKKPATKPEDAKAPEPVAGSVSAPASTTGRRPDRSSPPASAGREYSPPGPPSQSQWSPFPEDLPTGGEPMPTKTFREEYEQARVERADQAQNTNGRTPLADGSAVHRDALATSFPEALEQERAKQKKAESPE
jgi:hypothetical protein